MREREALVLAQPVLPSLRLRREVVLHRGGWPQGKAQHGTGLFSSFRDLDSSVSLSLAPVSLLGLLVTYGGELQTQGSEPVIWQFCCVSAGPRLGLSSKCAQREEVSLRGSDLGSPPKAAGWVVMGCWTQATTPGSALLRYGLM